MNIATRSPRVVEISMTSITTLSIWLACLAVGLIGVVIPYARPRTPQPPTPPIQAELLDVALTPDAIVVDDVTPPKTELATPPPVLKALTPSVAPALIPVAAPNPAIAFELPVTGPTRIVEANEASYSTPAKAPVENTGTQPPVQKLTFGSGEGKQPMRYPDRAQAEGQEGVVGIEFTVGSNGRTVSAEVTSRSPWPLLNDEAIRSVRERWRFAPGTNRRYQISIRFQLSKKL